MTVLVDVVNFNADASCLGSATWLDALGGGQNSHFCRWLELYPSLGRRVVLGLTGATVADLAVHNPEAISLIRANPDTFQIILRPFAHDAALLRLNGGFVRNVSLGQRTLERELGHICPYFLPPEFMLTNEQLTLLCELGVHGTFINPTRHTEEQQRRLPHQPYRVDGLFGAALACIPLEGDLTASYIKSLQELSASPWNRAVAESKSQTVFTWRDGESSFFIPDGLERERRWLSEEADHIERAFLPDPDPRAVPDARHFGEHILRSYPVHSFRAWMKEFRMMGYLKRVWEVEKQVDSLDTRGLALWLHSIGSDVMSAVEKHSPSERLRVLGVQDQYIDYTIYRSERGFEGEEALALLERLLRGAETAYLERATSPGIRKLRARLGYLLDLSIETE